jgi:hypothetical protein
MKQLFVYLLEVINTLANFILAHRVFFLQQVSMLSKERSRRIPYDFEIRMSRKVGVGVGVGVGCV